MPKFTYDDIVRVCANPHDSPPRMGKAWIVGIYETEKEPGSYWKKFPPGVVYSVEFEDGSSTRIHEENLELWPESKDG